MAVRERPMLGEMPEIEIEELFGMYRPPVIVCGSSGSGKTVMLVDALRRNSVTATRIVVVTNSYSSVENAYLRSQVPKAIVREFDVRTLAAIWNDIIVRQDNYAKHTSIDAVDAFVQKHCTGNPNFRGIHLKLESLKNELSAAFSGQQKEYDEAVKMLHHDINLKFIAHNFWEKLPDLSEQDRLTVRACRSTPPHPIIYFDDVTAQLSSLKTMKDKVTIPIRHEGVASNTEMSQKDAALALLLEMMTKGRQYAEIAFFVHNFSTFESNLRQLVGPVVICTTTEAAEFSRIRTFGSAASKQAQERFKAIGGDGIHKLVFFPNLAFSPSGSEFAVIAAKKYEQSIQHGCPNWQLQFAALMRAASRYTRLEESEEIRQQGEDRTRMNVAEFLDV